MKRTLPSRRDLGLGSLGKVYRSSTLWIEEGKVPDDEFNLFPWLRSVQVQGMGLTIVGSSRDAVRVCVEAWHAGFKPVLIIMEDKARCKETAEVRELVLKFGQGHFRAGMFTCGPRMIISESSRCLVHLDEKGRATDVNVCTDSGGMHSLAETWEIFRGPAIIVDDVATVELTKAEEDDRTRLFLSNMRKARAVVVDPKFWEDRYDPERLSFWCVGYKEMAPNLIIGFVQMACNVSVHRYMMEDDFPLWRSMSEMLLSFPCGIALFNIYGSAIGLQLRNDRPTILTSCFGLFFWLIKVVHNYVVVGGQFLLSDFASFSSGLVFTLTSVMIFAKFVKKVTVTKPMMLWFASVVFGSIGLWCGLAVILMMYLIILGFNLIGASVFLTVTLCLAEGQMIELMRRCYSKFVWGARKQHHDRVLGDQKLAFSVCVIMIHGFVETGRLVSMICGAVRARDTIFLWTNAVAVIMGVTINICDRSGWFGCLVVRMFGKRIRPYVEYLLCPTAAQGLHVDVKFAVGWPRFFLVAALFVGRGVIHGNWETKMLNLDPSAWCWNGIVLGTFLMAVLGEVTEDWLVYAIICRWPSPQWECFGTAMVNNFDTPGCDDVFHMHHYIVPRSAFLAPSPETTRPPCLKRASVKSRLTTGSTKWVQELAPSLTVSPNFKQARTFNAIQLQHFIGGSIVVILTIMSYGLGSGNLFGYCKPILLREFKTVMRNTFLWNVECDTEIGW